MLMPLAFESFNFDAYDLVISVTSEAAKGIITKPQTSHVCYCLTPTRYLWSGHNAYFPNPTMKWLSKPIVKYLRVWDKIASQRPDVVVAISTEVKERIKKYYQRDSGVIFPPVGLSLAETNNRLPQKYFLVVSRLVTYKRVDLVVKTFNRLGLPLVVIGTGHQALKLKCLARKKIKFVGFVTDEELKKYYRGAKALIMPQEEDFGLVAVEAQGLRIPVIAYGKGGAKDTVINGKTGILFADQTVESLTAAIEKFDKWHPDGEELITNAARFSKSRFQKAFIRACFGGRLRD